MATAPALLALRFAGQDHALEPGRDYLLGSGSDCDFRLAAAAGAHEVRISVTSDGATIAATAETSDLMHNGRPVSAAALNIGDVLCLGEQQAIVVVDDGKAIFVPIPAMRTAAVARKLSSIRVAAAALRHPGEQTLADLLAIELRRAPWFVMSIVLHLLLLLLMWLCVPNPPIGGRSRTTIAVDLTSAGPAADATRAEPPAVVSEPGDPLFDLPAPDVVTEPDLPTEPDERGLFPNAAQPSLTTRIGKRPAPTTGETGDGSQVDAIGSGGFRETVGELRKSGLEIVFVFDSTGSMSRMIFDTRSSIAQMLTVLQQLVPDARFGMVAYRDHGRREEYLVRQVPLGHDFWRAVNFVQFVTAEGGGDRPEDVRAGLRAAFEQQWQRGGRRVVVLAGDAPPHDADWQLLLNEIGSFTKKGNSYVHALITAPDPSPQDTQQAFTKIAEAGRGICERLGDRDRVLQRVLSFAFGREFEQDLASVIAAVEKAQTHVDVKALDLVRRGGPELTRVLQQNPVPQTVWNSLVRRPNRKTVAQLIDLLVAKDTPEHTRQAIAAALQRIFELPLPPIDPAMERGLTAAQGETLRRLAERLPE